MHYPLMPRMYDGEEKRWFIRTNKPQVAAVRRWSEQDRGAKVEIELSQSSTGDFQLELTAALDIRGAAILKVTALIDFTRDDPKVVVAPNVINVNAPIVGNVSNLAETSADLPISTGVNFPGKTAGAERSFPTKVLALSAGIPTVWTLTIDGVRQATMVTGDCLCIGRDERPERNDSRGLVSEAFVPASLLNPGIAQHAHRISRRSVQIQPILPSRPMLQTIQPMGAAPDYRVTIHQSTSDFEARLTQNPQTLPELNGKPVRQGESEVLHPGGNMEVSIGYNEPDGDPQGIGRLNLELAFSRPGGLLEPSKHAILIRQRKAGASGPRERLVWMPTGPWPTCWTTQLQDSSELRVEIEPNGATLLVSRASDNIGHSQQREELAQIPLHEGSPCHRTIQSNGSVIVIKRIQPSGQW
jgi:hypothetical protein